jgi:hypothetical protein
MGNLRLKAGGRFSAMSLKATHCLALSLSLSYARTILTICSELSNKVTCHREIGPGPALDTQPANISLTPRTSHHLQLGITIGPLLMSQLSRSLLYMLGAGWGPVCPICEQPKKDEHPHSHPGIHQAIHSTTHSLTY